MKLVGVAAAILVAVVSLAAAKEAGVFNSSLPVTLPAPTGLVQKVARTDRQIPPREWISSPAVRFSARSHTEVGIRLQVELAKDGALPSGNATATEPFGADKHSVVIRNLATGTYKWWGRFYSGNAVSPWVAFSSATAFGVDTARPSTPVITSSTDPVQGKVYRSGDVTLAWSANDAGSGIAGYRYSFVPASSVAARPAFVLTKDSALRLTGLSTGYYILTVEARNHPDTWSAPATYRVRLDSTAPTIAAAGFSTFAFNPHYTSMEFNYQVSEPSWVHIGIYGAADNQLVRIVARHAAERGVIYHYWWHGRNNHGRAVRPGAYNFFVRTTDAYGNSRVKEYSGLLVLNQVIIVSLSQQRLWAYEGHSLFLTSLVTTGNPLLPTPKGTFTILAKWHPFEFISPFPRSSWKWYEPSWVQYAMLFRVGGYYIHDAPWRTQFGPGSNTVAGTPGTNTTGTHGCVNVPGTVSQELFQWAPDGTPVRIVN